MACDLLGLPALLVFPGVPEQSVLAVVFLAWPGGTDGLPGLAVPTA